MSRQGHSEFSIIIQDPEVKLTSIMKLRRGDFFLFEDGLYQVLDVGSGSTDDSMTILHHEKKGIQESQWKVPTDDMVEVVDVTFIVNRRMEYANG